MIRPRHGPSILAIGLCLIAFAVPMSAEVELGGVLEATGGSLQWDPTLEFGMITKGANLVSFKPGLTFVLLNYHERIETGRISRGTSGEILLSQRGANAIEAALRRETSSSTFSVATDRPRIAAIVIDPGHGGMDPGTNHVHIINGKRVDLVEKNIVLSVATEVHRDLQARFPDKRIVLTRKDDTYVSLEQRTEIANNVSLNENEAMIFVSIHANASFDPKADGFEVWYLPPNYRREVIDPNELGSSKDLYPILNSMREEEYTIESVLLGRKILSGVSAEVGRVVPDRGLKAESWFVVRNARMPAVLIELGFVTNPKEAALLSDPSYLKKLSRGIYNGVASFVDYFDNQSGFME